MDEQNNKPIRVLIVDGKLISGGAEAFIMNVYRHIDRNVIQFDFLVHYKDRFFYDDEVERLGGKIFRLSFRNDHNIIKYIHELKIFFNSHKEYDVVWGHMDGLAPIYLKIAKTCGMKCTIAHSHIDHSEKTFKGVIKSLLRRNISKYADYRFACSSLSGKYLFGKGDFHVIPNAIDVKKFSFNGSVRNRIRDINKWNESIVIGHVGRFFSQKNHSFIIEVFRHIAQLNDKFVLCLCGDGDDRVNIEKKVKEYGLSDKVLFTGSIHNINEYYQAFDLFILPSLYEGLPVSGIEAQTSGLKCIFSDTITPEACFIKDNVTYLPITPNSEILWANKIIELSNYTRKDMSMVICDKGYSIDYLAKKLTIFFTTLDIKNLSLFKNHESFS